VAADVPAGTSDLEPESEFDETEIPGEPLGAARFFAGVVVAIATMVFGQIPMALISRSFPTLFLQIVPLVIAVTLTAGLLVAWISERITRSWLPIRASLFFFGAAFLAGLLWGYAIFTAVTRGLDTSHVLPHISLPIVGAIYVGTTAGLGALAGRLFANAASRRPRGVMITAIVLVVLAVIGAFKLR
jgi:hypothetical protein